MILKVRVNFCREYSYKVGCNMKRMNFYSKGAQALLRLLFSSSLVVEGGEEREKEMEPHDDQIRRLFTIRSLFLSITSIPVNLFSCKLTR